MSYTNFIQIETFINHSINNMPKLKTRKSAKKRFYISAKGKFGRKRAFKSYILEKKTSKRKRNLKRKMIVFKGENLALKTMLPYLR